MRKKAFTLLLVAALCLGLMPTDVLAEGMEASEATGEEIAGTAVQAAGVTVEGENAETVVTVEEEDSEEPSGDPETVSEDESEVETAADWEATLPQDLTGIWSEDVVAVAKSQLGYTESEEGYTRYGAWYGNESDDWDAMFVSFCLHYADVPESEFPQAAGAYAWITALKEAGQEDEADDQELYADVAAYVPEAGDLVFLDTDADGKADHVGIVEKVETKGTDAEAGEEASEEAVQKVTVIEGDSNDAVEEKEYDANGEDISDGDATITGYGVLPMQEDAENEEEEDVDIAELAWTGDTSGKVVLNLGNGNGKYNFADYAGNKNAGTDLRYTTDSLADYADDDGNVTINLPSDSNLDSTFTVVDASGSLNAVTVALGDCEAYDYKLVGWENIATGEYYDVSGGAVTADIDLDNENVFYADWIAASYDHGSETDDDLRDDIVSTKGFVTMHMYDYNELYNLYSESLVQDGTTSEAWTDSENLYNSLPYGTGERLTSSFIFVNDGTTAKTAGDGGEATGGMLSWPTDKTAGNSWTGSGAAPRNATEIWGITSPDSAPMNMLFDPEASAVGVHYVGEADYLFWLDDNGYYTYNSKEAAATYNQSDGCFYVYNGTQAVTGTDFSCFLPYNTYGETLDVNNGSVNYWFGMDMEVNFYLPNATGTEGGNQSKNGEDMVFNFSGDDDILIFVDDTLVLDMSGIHDESFGSINFAKGTITMGMSTDTDGNIIDGTTTDINLRAGAHDLKVYYMERGGYASNLEIQFNVAALWEYESGDVQTITAEKTWVDAQGNVIDPENLPDAYKTNGVEVGLFDVLGPEEDGTYGYTKSGDTYTVEYTDDSGVTRTYVYDNSGETPTLTYTESKDGTTTVGPETDDQVDSEGRVLDSDGYVVAWLEGEYLYIRIDKQTLSDANGWYYAWELLDPEATYEVMELSSSSSYTTTSTKENLLRYEYWSIIGDSQIEDSFEAGETLQVILTEAAQEASNTLGNTKDAMGWVIVATDSGITTQQVEFSQIADLQEIKDESSGQTSFKTIAGVTSKSEIDALGSGAIWYVIDAENQTEDLTGNKSEDFYLYCVLDGTQYYLILDETTLSVTSDSSAASIFCYDSLGELLVVMSDGSTERVEILPDGTITIGSAELEAARDDIRIYTYQETETSGFAFTAVNRFVEKDIDADGDGEFGDSGKQVNVGDTVEYKIDYTNYHDTEATITITDVLDEGLDYVEGSASDDGTYDAATRTVSWEFTKAAGESGSVTFKATVNEKALVKNEVENTATVQVDDDPAVETNPIYTPVPDKDVDADGDGEYGDSGDEVEVGDTLTYKIEYQNSYDDPATVIITDVLDIGLDFVSASDGGTYDESTRTITWILEGVEPHSEEGYYVTFTATVNSDALTENEITNDATVEVNEDSIVTNEVDNPVPDKDEDADDDETYGDSGRAVEVGTKITFTIKYHNGYDQAEDVIITDVLDKGLTYVDGSATDGGVYDEDTRTITWTISNVEAHTGGSVRFSAVVNENALTEHQVENTASVQIGDHPAKNTNTVYNPLTSKDVDIHEDGTYGDSGLQVKVGDTLTYIVYYMNSYDDPATVTITDVLDEGLDFVEASDGGTYDEDTRTITWVLENVPGREDIPEEGLSVTFKATVNENALVKHEVDNTATVQVNDDPSVDTNTVYNPVPEKSVDADGDNTYDDSGDEVSVGDTLYYKIDYFNGYDDPSTVTITDELDKGVDFIEASDGGVYDEETHTVTWTIEDVEAHTGDFVILIVKVNKNAVQENEVTNDATVKVGNDAVVTNEVDNTVSSKDVDADENGEYGDSGVEVKVGDTLEYIIYYDNGYDYASTVRITDVLDESLDYVEGSASDSGTYDASTRTITWVIEDVPAHTVGSVTFSVTVNENAWVKGEVENTGSVQIGDHDPKVTNTVYNPVTHKDVDIDPEDGLEYGDSGEQVHVGDTLTYKIDYFNGYDEGDENYDPTTVIITDELDVGLDFVEASDGGTYDDETRTITWVIEDVPAQEGGSVTFQATVNQDALEKNEVDNTATVTVGETSQVTNTVYNPVPEKDEDVDPEDDHEYGDSGKGVHVGTRITFTIKYHNSDDTSATVKITDVLDEGLTYIEGSASDNGTYDEDTHTLTWEIPNVAAHTSGFVTFTAEVNENALTKHEVENTASVQIGNHAEKETNPVYNPVPEKDVDIHGDGTYGDSGLQVHVGDTLTYIVYYDNAYDEASTITITDTLDEGLDFVIADNGGIYDKDSRTITWTIPDVAGHTSGSVTFQATVNETAYVKNEVDNTAYVQIGDHDPDQTNTVYNPVPKKSVDADKDGTYEDSGDEVNVGDMLMYMIDYFNGYDDPSTITITDKLDEGVDFDSASDGGTYDPETRTVTWVFEDVEPHTGGFVTLAVIVNKTALKENEVTNTAEIQIGNESEVTNTVDNTVPDKDVDADGDGNYGDSGVEVKVGDTLEYVIYYDNGYDEASEVTITDVLDESLDFVEASDGGVYDESTRTITWELGEIAAHTDGSVTFKVTVNENAWVKGEVENTGSVQVGPHDPKVTNTVYNPTPHKDVDIHNDDTFGDSGLQVKVGDTLTYKIEYFNGEEDEPADVTITDVLDKGLDFVSADNGGTYDEATRTITWVINDVPAQTGGNVTFKATVNEDALEKNEVDNTAKVAVDGHPEVETNTVYNPVPGKGVDTDEDQEYDDNGEEVQVGDTLEYKIDYMNSNDVSATVTITDELDEGLDFVEASNGGTYNESNRTITWVIEDVEAHTGGSVTFKATVNRNALELNEVKNTATVQVGNDAVVTNEVDNPVPDKGVDTDGDGEYDDDGEYVKIGDTLTYIITYDNADSVPVTVTITDTLDQGLDFVSADNGGTYDESTRTITWVIENAPAHTAGNVTFKATVNENVTEKYEVDNTAYVKVGTHEQVETNKVENPYRQYFPIDEEIVPDEDDPSTWVKEESVNEYNAIELEMTTQLPIIEPAALADGQFMMYFHNQLDHELVLDETTTDFKVYIGGTEISTAYYKITFDDETGDDCNFHVDVDLTALYNDGIVTADMLDGNTDITIYFFADLEGTDLNGSYTSTVWYDVYDGEDWEYTSNEDVVTVYTYEIKIQKVDENGDPLAGAEFGIYYDEECQKPVYRTYGSVFGDNQSSPYVVTSDADGVAMFYGLAEGSYYVKELSAPIGYVVSNEVIEIELNADTTDEDHVYSTTVENTPSNPDEPEDPVKGVDTDGDGDFNDNHLLVNVGDELTYRIWYYNYNDEAVTVTVTDTLDEALDFVSATDGGVYDESNRTITWTIENVPAKTVGYVDFKATVNEKAQEKGKVENTGSVKIGNDDFVNTNTVENPVESESEGGGNPTPGTGNPKSGTSTPKTSDTNNIALWLVLLIAAMAAVIVALRMKKRS